MTRASLGVALVVACSIAACSGEPPAGPAADAGTDGIVDASLDADSSQDAKPDTDAPTEVVCIPRTCAELGATCGAQNDGCGDLIDCGTCVWPEVCGGGGPSQCGDPNAGCVPSTCQSLGANCGKQGDGCGEVLDCGTCTLPETCGGNGVPSTCGAPDTTCHKLKTACAPNDCGPIADGCGGFLECGSCSGRATCGGGFGQPGTPSQCGGGTLPDGGPICRPLTCTDLGANCGPVGDGCGGLIESCGACRFDQVCGGGGVKSVCGPLADGGAGVPCVGLCSQQAACEGAAITSVSGIVFAPNGTEPLYNAVVYVPNAAVPPFAPEVVCDRCDTQASGSRLVQTVTGADGRFVLNDVPVGTNIPFIVELGHWRRQFTYTISAVCADTVLPAELTRLPRNHTEGAIPLMAIATGSADQVECVLRKIGIADSEFTNPADGGRVHLYVANGAYIDANTPSWDELWTDLDTLEQYDMVLLPCKDGKDNTIGPPSGVGTSAKQQNMIDYASAGGRVYATHYSFSWLANSSTPADGPLPFSASADFGLDQEFPPDPATVIGDINTSFPKGASFAQWLRNVGALTTNFPPTITQNISRHDLNAVIAPSQSWINVDPVLPDGGAALYPNAPQHYTFNTPVGAPAANQCGRVMFSDFHVSDGHSEGVQFPRECSSVPLTPQEKVLEFMLFDLASCVAPDQPPSCTPTSCAALGVSCGAAANGCGGLLDCGSCPTGQTCGGGGIHGQCAGPTCTPRSCAGLGVGCGPAGDGCGGLLDCGSCPTGQTCGGGGVPAQCGGPPDCSPRTCQEMGVTCGPAGDGCGNLIDCGTCSPSSCMPRSCAQIGAECGKQGDGCGELIDCGKCSAPKTCGGGGTPNVCGHH